MTILKVNPTQGFLLELNKDLNFLKKAHQLLDEKRTVLIQKLKELKIEAKKLRTDLEDLMAKGFKALELVNIEMGLDEMNRLADSSQRSFIKMELHEQSFMGIVVPDIIITETSGKDFPDYGFFRTSIHLDAVEENFRDALLKLVQLAGIENGIFRLAAEISKTTKRLNALEFKIIPDYDETITYLDNYLEELDRDELTIIKNAARLIEEVKKFK
ncbi:MAG: V-type ATP synthase subunit D [Candidatus Helarchaeota archaeon]